MHRCAAVFNILRAFADRVSSGDAHTLAQIEDRVGADLQYIRLNGALVGGLIGIVLAVLHHLIG